MRIAILAAGILGFGLAGAAQAALVDNGLNLQGINLNGINPQGVKLNGMNPQGVKLNGATAHGTAAIAVDGITLPGQAELTLAR